MHYGTSLIILITHKQTPDAASLDTRRTVKEALINYWG